MGTLFQPDEPALRSPPPNKGGSKLKPTELNRLAVNAYRYIQWPLQGHAAHNPLAGTNDADPINVIIRAKSQTGGGLLHVYPMGGGRSNNFIVKIPINGAQYRICIGTARYSLARYADAATLYFWKYRRTERPPEDSDFNTSLAIATQLLEVNAVRPQLIELEKWFIDSGIIKDAAAQAADDKAQSFIRDLRVARKYLERSRRYIRLLRENYSLDQPKLDAVDLMENELTNMLNNFSAALQAGAESVVAQIRTATPTTPTTKTDFEIMLDQQPAKAQAEREAFNQ